jgi:hypothetical protein
LLCDFVTEVAKKPASFSRANGRGLMKSYGTAAKEKNRTSHATIFMQLVASVTEQPFKCSSTSVFAFICNIRMFFKLLTTQDERLRQCSIICSSYNVSTAVVKEVPDILLICEFDDCISTAYTTRSRIL